MFETLKKKEIINSKNVKYLFRLKENFEDKFCVKR